MKMQTFMKQNEHFYFELNEFKYIEMGISWPKYLILLFSDGFPVWKRFAKLTIFRKWNQNNNKLQYIANVICAVPIINKQDRDTFLVVKSNEIWMSKIYWFYPVSVQSLSEYV